LGDDSEINRAPVAAPASPVPLIDWAALASAYGELFSNAKIHQDAWHHRSAALVRPRRRGDRMMSPAGRPR